MAAGRLAALSPGATTASVLYSTNVDTTASTVLHVAERGNSAATYRVGPQRLYTSFNFGCKYI